MKTSNRNIIKRESLSKLDSLVVQELERLEQIGGTLEDFEVFSVKVHFSKVERNEIEHNLESVSTPMFLYGYCKIWGIDSPILDNYLIIMRQRLCNQ